MKKQLCAALSLILLLGIVVSSAAFAQPIVDVDQPEEATPRFTGISTLASTLSISKYGRATCGGTVSIRDGYTVDLTVELKQDGTVIKTWTNSGSGILDAGGSYYVTSGHTYVVTTTAEVYNSSGTLVEAPSEDSLEKSY